MYEMMIDLETLDTKPSAVVLSIGAVIWETHYSETTGLTWEPVERFMRVLNMEEQLSRGRTVSQSTLLWWQDQDPTAKAEAFNPTRTPVVWVLNEFHDFAKRFEAEPARLNAFWASPVAFDLPIWEDLAMTFSNFVPWSYNQRYDVRTVVREANLSAKDHKDPKLAGVPHTPVYDCEWQISLLTAARQKLNRRIGEPIDTVTGRRIMD